MPYKHHIVFSLKKFKTLDPHRVPTHTLGQSPKKKYFWLPSLSCMLTCSVELGDQLGPNLFENASRLDPIWSGSPTLFNQVSLVIQNWSQPRFPCHVFSICMLSWAIWNQVQSLHLRLQCLQSICLHCNAPSTMKCQQVCKSTKKCKQASKSSKKCQNVPRVSSSTLTQYALEYSSVPGFKCNPTLLQCTTIKC